MRRVLIMVLTLGLLLLGPVAALWAQDSDTRRSAAEISAQTADDKGFITRFLQERLSGAGRAVTIDGFRGALSSRATFETLSIADDQGVWITLHDGAMQWNRSRLLRGQVEIGELSAKLIEIPRRPGGKTDPDAPRNIEARTLPEFNLPELPVGVHIDKLDAARVVLGQPVLGEPIEISVQGRMSLEGGEGDADLKMARVDEKRGAFSFVGGFDNSSRELKLNLSLDEDPDGIFSRLTRMHGRPAVTADIQGAGPLDSFTASLSLATNGTPRIKGGIALRSETDAEGAEQRGFALDLGGDIAALVPEDSRAFFGTNSKLKAKGWRAESGRMELPELSLETNALKLNGSLALNDARAPQAASLTIALGQEAGVADLPVVLPGTGDAPVTVQSGKLNLDYDSELGDAWVLDGWLTELATETQRIARLTLDGQGVVELTGEKLRDLSGGLEFDAEQIAVKDPALARAIGNRISGESDFYFAPGQAIQFEALSIAGDSYGLQGELTVDGLSSGLNLAGAVTAKHRDLSTLSGLAKRDLSGTAQIDLQGYYQLLTRAFDASGQVEGRDIKTGISKLDRLLRDDAVIAFSGFRDLQGLTLDHLRINAQRLALDATGTMTSETTHVTAQLELPSLADLDPDYSGALSAEAILSGMPGQRRLTVNGAAEDLRIGIAEADGALAGKTDLRALLSEQDGSYILKNLRISNPQIRAGATGRLQGRDLNAVAQLEIPQLGVLGRGLKGRLNAEAELTSEGDGSKVLQLTGTGKGLRVGQANVDAALSGPTTIRLHAAEKDGIVTLRDLDIRNKALIARAQGKLGKTGTDAQAKLEIATLGAFGAGLNGSLRADARLVDRGDGARRLTLNGVGRDLAVGQAQLDSALTGATDISLSATERAGVITIDSASAQNGPSQVTATGKIGKGATDISAEYSIGSLGFLRPGLGGAVTGSAQISQPGPRAARQLRASGTATGLRIGQKRVDPLLGGQTRYDLAATQQAGQLTITGLDLRNPQIQLIASGDPQSALNIDARLSDVALLAPGIDGPAQVKGTVTQGETIAVALDASAPGGTRARITGNVTPQTGSADLRVSGISDAAIANPFLRTRNVSGPVTFDLTVKGPPGLDTLGGTISLRNGQLSEPKLGVRLEDLSLDGRLNGGRVEMDLSAAAAAGGRISGTGSVDLLNRNQLDLRARLSKLIVRDPNLYEATLWGDLRISGFPEDGPLVEGDIEIATAELRIPSTGLGGVKAIPDITHRGDSWQVRATRARAGLTPFNSAEARAAGLTAPAAIAPRNPARLNLTLRAPNQFFIRGRGVDAEMGGELRLTGNARAMIPIGHLALIRGRVDLLGKRFDLDEGLVELQGSLIPILRLVAKNEQDGIITYIIIDGEARDPDIRFESDPELPQEEVLSQLLFGRGLDRISPLQAAQLANALAVLAGQGGIGVVGNIRDSVGLDDLDLTTDDDGNVSVRAGKYLSDNVYTDVSIDDDGKSRVNLNLDITPDLKARGSVSSDGESTLGVFFEKDY